MTSAARNTPNTMTVNGRSHRHSDHCGAGAAGALGKRGLDGMDRRASAKCLISGTRARSRLDERRVTMIDLTRRDVVMAAGGIAALALPGATACARQPQGRTLGYAVVGLGGYGLGRIVPEFANCAHSRLTGLVSGDRAKAERVAAGHGPPKIGRANVRTPVPNAH